MGLGRQGDQQGTMYLTWDEQGSPVPLVDGGEGLTGCNGSAG